MKRLYSTLLLLSVLLLGGVNSVWAAASGAGDGEADLKGRELYDYQIAQIGNQGLVRLYNKRSSTSFLTANTTGAVVGAKRATTGFSQIWIVQKSGSGYTLRSANTGDYLQADFGTPAGAPATLYIQYSPNNTSTQAYINISSDASFAGQTCLNLNGDGKTLYKWSYAGDPGSDWAIELATDISLDDVKAHFNEAKGYASELVSDHYYRLVSVAYDRYVTEADGILTTLSRDDSNFAQYWKFEKSGTGWTIKNVFSDRYVQTQGTTSAQYRTGVNASVFYIRSTGDEWEHTFYITNTYTTGHAAGMHTASTQGYDVVNWTSNATASVWAFQEVELTDEQIADAQKPYKEYLDMLSNQTKYQANLDALFADKACTTLMADIATLSDEALAANADYAALPATIQSMVLKVKNNTWQQFKNNKTGYTADYERFFRIADYKVYSNYSEMASGSNTAMSNAYGKLSGPTGIVANAGDMLCIYVDQGAMSECMLQVEAVTTEGVPGNHPTGTCTSLHEGLNLLYFSKQAVIYIFYQASNTARKLSLYPDIKIHIEGGQLQGYWDATRGMTNADWALLQQDLLKACNVLNLKTEHLVFVMNAELIKTCEPTEMEGLMRVWEQIPANEDRYMGLEDFAERRRNVWNCFSIDYQYMFATTYGTYYNETTLPTIMNYYNMTHQGNGNEGGAIWGPSHEMGHNRQSVINVVGTTESSNNVFSNINMFEQGISTTRGASVADVFTGLVDQTPWNGRDIWVSTRLYFQLYLYFHVEGHDTEFLPKLFKAMRKSGINKGTYSSDATWTDDEGTHSGAYLTNGANDYLKLAKTICDVAEADLSEFFEAYGMFEPVTKYHVNDYSNYLVTTARSSITQAKAYMRKYPKKLGNIMFIDDRIVKHKAIADNTFEGVPASDGYRVNCNNSTGYSVGTSGNYGDYDDFDLHEDYRVDGAYFTISGNLIQFRGTGAVGYKFYDLDGNLIWATNRRSATLPQRLRTLGPDNYRVVAAEAIGTDVPCPYVSTDHANNVAKVYFGSADGSRTWHATDQVSFDGYLPENALAVLETADAPANVTAATNVIAADSTAQSIVINGDQPLYIPVETTAASLTFAKSGTGYAALSLPFDVTDTDIAGLQTARYASEQLQLQPATSVAAGQPVVVQGDVQLTLTNAKLHAGDYQTASGINVLASDGQSVVVTETATPFTYNMDAATAIRAIDAATGAATNRAISVYDLTGRRLAAPTRAGIYIISGRKAAVVK